MNVKINEIVDAILRNNPQAVSANLSQLGLINGTYYDTAYLKQIIMEEIAYMRDEEGINFVSTVLDVPIDPSGEDAGYLQKISFEEQAQRAKTGSNFFSDYVKDNESLLTFAIVSLIIFLFVGTIFLIRKL